MVVKGFDFNYFALLVGFSRRIAGARMMVCKDPLDQVGIRGSSQSLADENWTNTADLDAGESN